MVILVYSKNEEDTIKIEGARVATIQNIDFSNTKGQLAPQSEVRPGRRSDPLKNKDVRVATTQNIDFSNNQG